MASHSPTPITEEHLYGISFERLSLTESQKELVRELKAIDNSTLSFQPNTEKPLPRNYFSERREELNRKVKGMSTTNRIGEESTYIVRENNGELFAFKVDLKDVYKASLSSPETIFCMAENETKIRAFLPWWERLTRKINFVN